MPTAATPPPDRRIPAQTLEELRARTPLRDLIGRRVKLTRSGRNWKGCCPFHDDRTPSFVVYDHHFHCFGCGEHGDAIDFVRKTKGGAFMDAVNSLGAEAGMESIGTPLVNDKHVNGNVNGHAAATIAFAPEPRETWEPMLPPPPGAPDPEPRMLRCDVLYTYRGLDGQRAHYVRRNEAKDDKRKEFFPLVYGRLS